MKCDKKHPTFDVACWLPESHFQPHRALVPNDNAKPNQSAMITESWESGRL